MFSLRAQARALGLLFLAGSVVGAITLLLPHDASVDDGPLFGLTVLAAAVGALALARTDRVPIVALHAAVALGSLMLGAANYFVGPTALYPILYSWTALFAFTFFSFRAGLAHMAVIAASYAVVLGVAQHPSAVVRWVLAVGTPLVAGVLISRILEVARVRSRVLGESEGRLRAIVDSAPEAFVMVDDQGTVLAWNREAERVFGIAAGDALGSEVSELIFAPEDRAAHIRRRTDYFAAPADGGPWETEVEMIRADGAHFPADVVVSRVVADGRDLVAVFVSDISHRLRQRRGREELYREQTARREAEEMAEAVHGLQMLLDAALSHRRLEDMLQALLPRLCEVLNAEAATILLADEEGVFTARATTAETGGVPPLRLAAGEGISGRAARDGASVLVQDPDPAEVRDPALAGCHSILSVPLMAGDQVTALIQVGVPPPRRFGDDDLMLLGLAADRVALVIEHAQVYERELRIAETLQRSLLPDRLPSLPGLQVAARYLPAASEAEVGGDWYDVIALDSGRVGLVMGDVAGKGLAAASLVGGLRSALRAYALEGHGPLQVVELLNQLVWSEVDDSEMVTLVYLVIDPVEGSVEFVNAGHPPPLISGPDGSRFLDGPSSVPLGVMPFPAIKLGRGRLGSGSTILLYTDGLVEIPGELLDDGLARLRAVVQGADLDAERLCDQVVAALVRTGGASDDVALLALHAPLLSAHFRLELGRDPGELAYMRSLLRRWLAHAEGSEQEIAEILAAAGEAVANAIEHSGGLADGFEVAGSVDDGRVEITVRDFGAWREPSAEGNARGRGLTLMRQMMDSVEVVPQESGTMVRMSRRIGNGEAPVG
jgi:PAS domain S-box-containing protein